MQVTACYRDVHGKIYVQTVHLYIRGREITREGEVKWKEMVAERRKRVTKEAEGKTRVKVCS